MLAGNSIGEWVRGPFANATIEGFIVNETYGSYDVVINKIDAEGPIPPRLKFGSIHNLPKRVVEEFFIMMNVEQQKSMIVLAKQLKQDKWADELIEQFFNPFASKPVKLPGKEVYSALLRTAIKLTREVKEKLFVFYQEAVRKGLPARFNRPDDINSAGALDAAVSSIFLVAKSIEGIEYIKTLVRKGDTQT